MANRQKYIDEMADQLKKWDEDIQKLEQKADAAQTHIEQGYREQINELRQKQKETREKLDKIKNSGSDAWLELKNGFEKSRDALESSLKNALDQFKK